MECNKEDAQAAKEIAEKKFLEEDIASAKKFAMKAQNMYPQLDGLSQFMATLDLYISVAHKINGEIDYYRVLNVTPSDDDDTIRKNYRKLALLLHPDKNKSVGADGAFKILSEAWNVLSDKTRRFNYDQKCLLSDLNQRYHANVSTPTGEKGSNNLSEQHSIAKTQKSSMSSDPAQHHSFSADDTFWTICTGCSTKFEYLKIHHCANLFCQNCQKTFVGFEVQPPNINGYCSIPMPTCMQGQAPGHTNIEHPHSAGKKPVSTAKKPGSTTKKEYVARPIVSALPASSEAHKYTKWRGEMKTTANVGVVFDSDTKGDELNKKERNTTAKAGVVSGSDVKGDELKKKGPIDEQGMKNTESNLASQMPSGNEGGSVNVHQKINMKIGREIMNEAFQKDLQDALINKASCSIFKVLPIWDNVIAPSNNMEKDMKRKRKARQKGDGKGRNAQKSNQDEEIGTKPVETMGSSKRRTEENAAKKERKNKKDNKET